MQKPEHHILVCGSFRISGEAQGVCAKKGSHRLIQYIENEIIDRGMTGTIVSSTGCLKVCDRGPAIVIYPENFWYGGVETEDAVDKILDALEEGNEASEFILE